MTEDDIQRDDEARVSRLSGAPRPTDEDDAIVHEYEQRYNREPKQKPKPKPRSYSTLGTTDNEKMWAAVAHGSIWVTLLAAIITGGVIVPLIVFVPLGIYFAFRERSDYVAFHALQAFVVQLIGTVGWLALMILAFALWVIGLLIAALLMVLLVGFVLLPVWALLGIAVISLLTLLPLVALMFATIATVQTYRGRDYRYPYIGQLVDRQMAGGLLSA